MAEVVRAAIEVDIDEPQARHIPDEVALAPVNDKIDARLGPEVGLPRVPELARLVQDLVLGPDGEDVVVVHRPALVSRAAAVVGRNPCRRPCAVRRPIADQIMYRSDLTVKSCSSRHDARPRLLSQQNRYVTVRSRGCRYDTAAVDHFPSRRPARFR